ncbi:MAG: GIY-YIG nuclease family protein [Bacteroidales bacterium]|nr:GIY-YIG nuclease family protein [Bacteroidales bacterium]
METIFIEKYVVDDDIEWIAKDYSFVRENETLCFVNYSERIKTKITSPCDGYLYQGWHRHNVDFPNIPFKKPLANIFDSIQDLFSYEYCCEGSSLEIDPYTGLRRIEWINPDKIYFDYGDGFCIDFIDDKMLFRFCKSDKLQIGDCISFLFGDGRIIDFPITMKPIKDYDYEASFVLYQEDVETFLNSTLVSYRVTYKGVSRHPETIKTEDSNLDEAIRAYVKNHFDVIKQLVPNYQLPQRTVLKTSVEYKFNWCYVYLMRDNTNGYHKIGISNKPEYREKTLQSEKPSIEMLACKKFPTRKIAEAIESALHTVYCQQRVRGEWFNLNDEDVAAIIETLK